MNVARYIESVEVENASAGPTTIAIFEDGVSGGVFGIEASYVDQVTCIIASPFNPCELMLLGDTPASSNWLLEVDQEAINEFSNQPHKYPLFTLLTLMAAMHDLLTAASIRDTTTFYGALKEISMYDIYSLCRQRYRMSEDHFRHTIDISVASYQSIINGTSFMERKVF